MTKHWVISGELVQGVAIGDVDNDGEMELAACLPRAKEVRVLDSAYRVKYSLSFSGAPRSIVIDDVDGDGRNELLVGTSGPIPCSELGLGCVLDGQAGNLFIGELSRLGVFSSEWVSPAYYFRRASEIAVGDLNGNGKKEVILGLTFYDRTLVSHEFNGSTYPKVFEDPIGSDVDSVFMSGNLLIVGTKCWADYGIRVYRTNSLIFSNLGSAASEVGAGDLNGDGEIEIVRSTSGGCGGGEARAAVVVYDSKFRPTFSSGPVNAAPSWSAPIACGKLFDGQGSHLVLGTSSISNQDSLVHIFQYSSGSYVRVWQDPQGTAPEDVLSLVIGDVARDGHNELYAGQTRGLVVYLPQTEPAPKIWTQPASPTNYVGEAVSLTVFATGTWPLSYQWRKDGVDLVGTTNATLVLANATVAATGDYTVFVANAFGSVTSAVARVSLMERPWPYVEEFQGSVGREWSHRQTDVTPVGNRRFLGQFGNDTVGLTLTGLPAHQEVTVSFNLFIIRSWDGGWAGPEGDIWDLSLAAGPTLLHTTFNNHSGSTQTFPGPFPGVEYPSQTGAAEHATLGYDWPMPTPDSVYQFSFNFPHTGDSLRLDFSGMGLQEINDESWGLDNVRVELSPAPTNTSYVRTTLAPTYASQPSATNSIQRVAVSGVHAAALRGDGSVQWLDLKDPAKPLVLGNWEPFVMPCAITVAGNLVYIASWELDFLSTVEIVDFSDPAKPVLRGYYDTPGYAQGVALAGSRAYVADGEAGLHILDVSDPAFPQRLGGFNILGSVDRVQVSGRYAYVTVGNWVLILDINDPGNPRRAGVYEAPGEIQSLKVSGSNLYLAQETGELQILDVSDPGDIRLLGSYRSYGTEAVAVAGRFAYLAGSGGVRVLDVSNPTNITWLAGAWNVPAEDVALMGNYAVVAGGNKGLAIYQLQQSIYPPLNPPVVAGGMITMTWPYLEGVRLQMATNLAIPFWPDVPGSDGTNTVSLPMTEGAAFFRLAIGSKPIPPPPGFTGSRIQDWQP